jgi:signal transduction histidine kinase
VAARAGLLVRVTSRVEHDIPPELATAAFRIFQEALTNAVRHARATRIAARVTVSRGRLLLFLRDNGVGMPGGRSTTEGHLGLLGMQERARSVGGTIALRSHEGRGTLVAVVLPLPMPGRA